MDALAEDVTIAVENFEKSKKLDSYKAQVESLTGREVTRAQVQCPMCGGLGFNQFESVCERCAGEGKTTEWVFADCQHLTESGDCQSEGCGEVDHSSEAYRLGESRY